METSSTFFTFFIECLTFQSERMAFSFKLSYFVPLCSKDIYGNFKIKLKKKNCVVLISLQKLCTYDRDIPGWNDSFLSSQLIVYRPKTLPFIFPNRTRKRLIKPFPFAQIAFSECTTRQKGECFKEESFHFNIVFNSLL